VKRRTKTAHFNGNFDTDNQIYVQNSKNTVKTQLHLFAMRGWIT